MHPHSDIESLFLFLYPRFCHCILIHSFFTNTIHTSTPSYLSEQQLNHLLGHHFKRFLRINKGHQQDWSSFFARYFSCSWRNIKIASVKRPTCHKSERHVVNFTFLLSLLSMILYKFFIACYTTTPYPCMSHKPTHPLYPCRHSPTNSRFDIC